MLTHTRKHVEGVKNCVFTEKERIFFAPSSPPSKKIDSMSIVVSVGVCFFFSRVLLREERLK